MSHFLRSLVERTLAPAGALQPRLPSRFELAPRRGGLAEQRVETLAAAPVEAAPVRAAWPAPPSSDAPSGRADAAPAPARSAPTYPVPAVPTVTPVAPLGQHAAPRLALEPTAHVAEATASARDVPAAAPRPAWAAWPVPPAPSITTLLVERTRETRVELRPQAGDAPLAAAAGIGERREAAAALAPSAAPRAAEARIPAPLAPVVAPPLSTPAAPAIHVTIGRVEIRSVTPPAEASARRPAPERAPAVSLGDYLARRAVE